jgi:2-keto-4-pentenoate hydratase/2-oxohepta-3-ene-1,7-dioic acid hydratase in catechol pathway
VELGYVIGKQAKNIKKSDYLEYIQAYFICLDLTDRTFLQGINTLIKIAEAKAILGFFLKVKIHFYLYQDL